MPVLESIPDWVPALRALVPGGRLVLSLEHPCFEDGTRSWPEARLRAGARVPAGGTARSGGRDRACRRGPADCHAGMPRLVSQFVNQPTPGPLSSGLAPLRGTKTILLTTYKRDGTPVDTPVSLAFDGDRAFFRSYDQLVPLAHRLRRYDTLHYELHPASAPHTDSSST